MNYMAIFECKKCSNFRNDNKCRVSGGFDNGDPSTCPFLCCPFFSFNYELMIPKSGDFYIVESDGILYTPIFADLEESEFFDLRKCDVSSKNGLTHLSLDLKYCYVLHKKKQDVIENSSIMHIDSTSIHK